MNAYFLVVTGTVYLIPLESIQIDVIDVSTHLR